MSDAAAASADGAAVAATSDAGSDAVVDGAATAPEAATQADVTQDAEHAKRPIAELIADDAIDAVTKSRVVEQALSKARSEAKNLRQRAKDAEANVKSKLESEATSAEEKFSTRLAELESKLKASETVALVERVARQHNIPDELVGMLKGESEEELSSQAESLAKHIAKPASPALPGKPKDGQDSKVQATGLPSDPKAMAAYLASARKDRGV